jgi:AraC-like DNA-binding protein
MIYFLIIAMSQGFAAAYLLWRDFKFQKPFRYLIYLIILISGHLLIKISLYFLVEEKTLFDHLVTSFSLGTGPLLLFYAYAEVNGQHLPRKRQVIHLLPLIMFSLLYVSVFFLINVNGQEDILYTYKVLASLVVISSNAGYLAYILVWIARAPVSTAAVRWLKWPLLVALVPFLLAIGSFIVPLPENTVRFAGAVAATALILSILKHRFAAQSPQVHQPATNGKYERSSLTLVEAETCLACLQHLMESKKLYLNRELTLDELAEKCDISKHHLTQAMNTKLNKNYYQYVNEYRVKEACRQLEKGYDENFLQLAYSSGFNSKTSFNTYFKKVTGLTPQRYQKKCTVA